MTEIISGTTRIYGIIGYPVKHSFSPRMHNAAFSELKMDVRYLAFPVKPEQVQQALEGIRVLNISGVNVTVPHKSAVIPYLDEIAPLAQKLGAVNTILNVEGRLSGTNTDISGFVCSLGDFNFSPKTRFYLKERVFNKDGFCRCNWPKVYGNVGQGLALHKHVL